MDRKSWASYIEVSSNIAVLVVAMALLGAIVSTRWWPSPDNVKLNNGLQKGQVVAQLPSIDFAASRQTLIAVLSTKCHYCTESLPFYRRLLEEQQRAQQATRIVAVFPNPQTEVDQYKQQNQLTLEALSAVNSSTLGVTGTPTLILIDSAGHVVDFWVGKLSQAEEQQIIEAVRPS